MQQQNPIDQLIQQFSKLPGLGPRSARRVVLKLLRERERVMRPLMESLAVAHAEVRACGECGNLDVQSPCRICADPRRDASMICVVEELADLWAVERSAMFRGRYHVLGGVLSAIEGIGPEQLRIGKLVERASADEVSEVILATNQTVDGQATAHYLMESLLASGVKVSRLAQGIPLGGELDYLDDGTLGVALQSRSAFG